MRDSQFLVIVASKRGHKAPGKVLTQGDIDQRKLKAAADALDCLSRGFTNKAPSQNDAIMAKEARGYLEFVLAKPLPKEKEKLGELLDRYSKAPDTPTDGIRTGRPLRVVSPSDP